MNVIMRLTDLTHQQWANIATYFDNLITQEGYTESKIVDINDSILEQGRVAPGLIPDSARSYLIQNQDALVVQRLKSKTPTKLYMSASGSQLLAFKYTEAGLSPMSFIIYRGTHHALVDILKQVKLTEQNMSTPPNTFSPKMPRWSLWLTTVFDTAMRQYNLGDASYMHELVYNYLDGDTRGHGVTIDDSQAWEFFETNYPKLVESYTNRKLEKRNAEQGLQRTTQLIMQMSKEVKPENKENHNENGIRTAGVSRGSNGPPIPVAQKHT